MNDEDLKIRLASEISKTEKLIAEYKDMTQPVSPDDAIGRISRMDAINNQSITESALRVAEQKLKQLKEVESKIGSSDFGVCRKCKTQIPLARILIRPQSVLCVKCTT